MPLALPIVSCGCSSSAHTMRTRMLRSAHPSLIDEMLKRRAVFPVAIMDQVLAGGKEAPFFHGHVVGHLDHPRLIGMRCEAGHVDLPARKVDKKQHVRRYQAGLGPDLGSEEVSGHEDIQVRADELFPRRGGLTLWCWREAMALEDVANSLVTDGIPEVGECADDPV